MFVRVDICASISPSSLSEASYAPKLCAQTNNATGLFCHLISLLICGNSFVVVAVLVADSARLRLGSD